MISDQLHAAIVCTVSVLVLATAGLVDPMPLYVGAVVLFGLAAIAMSSPIGAILAVIVVLPYFYAPIHIGTQALAASELMLVATVAGAGGRLALDWLAGGKTWGTVTEVLGRSLRTRLLWFLAVLIVAAAISTLFAFDSAATSASLREVRWTLLQPFALIVLLAVFVTTRQARQLLVISLVAAGIVAALHASLDVISGGGVVGDNIRRLSGPLPHPNALALFLVRPFAVAAALVVQVPVWRRFTVPPAIVLGLVTVATFSRGAMIAIVAVAAMLAMISSRRLQVVLGASVTGMIVVALLVAGERMRSALDGGSVSLRLDIWSSAARMIRDSPIVGYGPDQFLYAYAPRYILPTAWDERFTAHAHNLVLDAWIRLGLIGAIAAVVAFIIVVQSARSLPRMNASWDALRTASTVALVAVFAHATIDNGYFGHDLAMSVWLLAWLAFPTGGQHGIEDAT